MKLAALVVPDCFVWIDIKPYLETEMHCRARRLSQLPNLLHVACLSIPCDQDGNFVMCDSLVNPGSEVGPDFTYPVGPEDTRMICMQASGSSSGSLGPILGHHDAWVDVGIEDVVFSVDIIRCVLLL